MAALRPQERTDPKFAGIKSFVVSTVS